SIISEQRRFGQRDSGTLRVEVHEFQAPAQGAENRMARAAERTVVPGDEQRGMVDEVVVAHGIAPRMVDRRQDDGIVGRGHRSAVTYAVGMGEARLLPAEGHYGDEPQPGEGIAQFEYRLGSRQVEAYGHAAEERPEAMGMKPADRGGKCRGSLAAIGT